MANFEYTAKDIKVLEGLEPVRRRPGMYIGSTDNKGLHHMIIEVVDNSVDESLAGFTKNVWVTLKKDGSAEIRDDGRGIPVDKHKSGVSALEIAMTKLHAGAKFDSQIYKVSGGLHGVGISVVNALSSYLRVEIRREGKIFAQEYKRGKPTASVKEVGKTKETGTATFFTPDKKIFKDSEFKYKIIEQLIRERAYLVSGLKLHLKDERNGKIKHFYFEGGISSLVRFLNRNKKPIHQPIFIKGGKGGEDDLEVEASIQYNDGFSEHIESFVNVINTKDGGTHLTGFKIALTRAINDYAKKIGIIKGIGFTGEDTKEGLTAVIAIKMLTDKIQFESQTKAKLNNSEAQGAVATVVKEGIDNYFEEHPKEARRIIEKIGLAARARMAARAAKEAVIRKSEFFSNALPGKLADCQEKDPAFSELFIVEGDSAGGCFSGNTKIALSDGRKLTFKELVQEWKKGKTNYCYTIKKNGEIGLEKIAYPRLTKKRTKVIKVFLDNNESIFCTPNHKFMLRDGSFIEAKNLKPTMSLMPFRKTLSKLKGRITIKDYEMVLDPKTHKWIFTHLLADLYNLDYGLYHEKTGTYRHHLDFNKLNNNPDNIIRMIKEKHLQLHQKHIKKTLHKKEVIEKCNNIKRSPKYRQKISETMKKLSETLSARAKKQWENPKYKEYMAKKYLEFYYSNHDYRKKLLKNLNKAQKNYWSREENRINQTQKVREYFKKHPEIKQHLSKKAKKQWLDKNLLKWRSQKTKEQWTDKFRKKRKKSYDNVYLNTGLEFARKLYEEYGSISLYDKTRLKQQKKNPNLVKLETLKNRFFDGNEEVMLGAVKNFNHKIKYIEKVREKIDVYDLEVPNTHNFALASGIFVHNSAKQGRNRKFQAILPLGGKILNTERAHLDKIISFDELKDLIIALGMGIGETLNPSKARYHRIIIMTDADVDGQHIDTLLLTFFYRHLKPIIDKGYLYIAIPPLYKIQIDKNSYYAYNDEEKEKILNKKVKGNKKASIQRYKGLGEMNPQQLWETTMDPDKRLLKKITIEDSEKADEVFTMLMGEEVPPRKRFIQMYAKNAELDI